MKENIEEDIKIIENYLTDSAINEMDSDFFKNGGWEIVDLKIPKAMKHILSDYKRVLKENEELKEDNKHQWKERCRITFELENSIPVQKVKDKIEELNKKEQELQNSISDEEREEYSDASISFNLMDIYIRREVLQELIEESEENKC